MILLGVLLLGSIGMLCFTSSVTAHADSWYNPIWFTDNLECKKGYAYNSANMKNGNCRFNTANIINNSVNNIANAFVSGLGGQHLP